MDVTDICRQLQVWMLAQIPDGAAGLDQLACDGKTPRGSIVASDGSGRAFIAQVTPRRSERRLPKVPTSPASTMSTWFCARLVSKMDLEGVLNQADALHAQKPVW